MGPVERTKETIKKTLDAVSKVIKLSPARRLQIYKNLLVDLRDEGTDSQIKSIGNQAVKKLRTEVRGVPVKASPLEEDDDCIKFSSENDAIQYLANITGEEVEIEASEDEEETESELLKEIEEAADKIDDAVEELSEEEENEIEESDGEGEEEEETPAVKAVTAAEEDSGMPNIKISIDAVMDILTSILDKVPNGRSVLMKSKKELIESVDPKYKNIVMKMFREQKKSLGESKVAKRIKRRKVFIDLVKEDPWAISDIVEPDVKVQIEAVRTDPEVIMVLPYAPKEVQMEAVKKNPKVLRYIKNPEKEVKELAEK